MLRRWREWRLRRLELALADERYWWSLRIHKTPGRTDRHERTVARLERKIARLGGGSDA